MVRLLGISGSLRKASYNTTLLRAAQQGAGSSVAIDIATLHGIPLYDGDVEASSGVPEAVTALKERIVASDALLLATPEYNSSFPGVMKNAFDWLSRPPADMARVFGGRPVAVLGASPSGFGTVLAQAAWLPVLRHLGAQIWTSSRLAVSAANTKVDAEGNFDAATRAALSAFVQGFADWVQSRRAG
ncbi:MAG: NADPH-dependent FMN reductase [Steroidobacteraceae bacterium]